MSNYHKNITIQLDKLNENIDSIITETQTLVTNKNKDASN